ncbi:MAG: hypothetical protein CM15mV58_680 [uncultured marine virus]|nr:MAG: hypothetical protein CM15mV58_680 [uncultured marine virus]
MEVPLLLLEVQMMFNIKKFGDSGDDDIGNIFYYHGNNNMVFTTNASEAMRINSSGQVGIGNDNPGQLLSIKDTSAQCQQSLTSNKW